jgi:hypothetical protein
MATFGVGSAELPSQCHVLDELSVYFGNSLQKKWTIDMRIDISLRNAAQVHAEVQNSFIGSTCNSPDVSSLHGE